MARKENKKPEPPPPSSAPNNNSESGSDADDSDSDVVSSSSSDAAPPTTTTTTIPTTIKRTLTPHHTKQTEPETKPDSESESESESDDDTPPPPPKPATATKQPRSKPPTSKRPAQSDNNKPGPEKRPKKDTTTTTGPSATTPATTSATPQKALFQRLWSDEDEIVILKGMIEYKEKKGVDPMTHVDDFLEFIKKSLHVADANKAQINSKVRRLKKRFINAQKKKLTDPHEITAFELSKKIWRGVEEVDEVNHRENGVTLAVVPKEEKKGGGGNVNVGVEEVELGFLGKEGEVVKAAMARMGDGERKEMRKMVETANAAYLDGFLLKLKVLEVAARKNLERVRNLDQSE